MKFTSNGMTHTPAPVMVLQTTDYNVFNMIKGNRTLDMNKIKRILSDIERGTNLLKYCPVLVLENKNKLEIIDGQHRFMVAKKIKSPVYYIMAESLSLYDIARMNSNTEKWKAKDFISCYCELSNPNYLQLQDILKKYPALPITTAINLLESGKVNTGGKKMDSFQRGEFKAEHPDATNTILEAISQFQFPMKYSRAFMRAIEKVIISDVFPIETLIEKVNAAPDQLHPQENYKKYLQNLEEIAMKGKQKRVAIY